MFDIKLTNWAEHLLSKLRLKSENFYENRKVYLCNPILNELNNIFNTNIYKLPSDDVIMNFCDKFISNKINCFEFANQIKLDPIKIKTLCKKFIEKEIKDKWIYSDCNKESQKLITNYLKNILLNFDKNNNTKIIFIIQTFLKEEINKDINLLAELLIANLKKEDNLVFNTDINIHMITKLFIEKINKNTGKKH